MFWTAKTTGFPKKKLGYFTASFKEARENDNKEYRKNL